jgi:hypothetical protein
MKIISFIRWFFVVFFIGLFGILTAWLFYPLWNLTHWKVFWIWEDSTKYKEDGSHKEDYRVYIEQLGGKETFKVKYKWHALRNRIWNLNSLFTPKKGVEIIEKLVTDKLYRDGKKLTMGGKWQEWAGLKYKADEGQDPWQVRMGDEIDFKYSNIGTSYFWYKVKGRLFWRYSTCRNVFGKYWFTFIAGTNNKRYVISIKIQK